MRGYPVTQGFGAGSNLRVFPWEVNLVKGILSARIAALSVARGAGKSSIIAAIASAFFEHLVETRQRADVVCVASSFGQGKIILDHASAYLADKLQNRQTYRIRDTSTQSSFTHRATGAAFKCISSDPKRAHGLAPALLLCDEPAQWLDTRASAMWAALKTSLGKIPGSRAVCLGTRPKDETHFFARLLDGGAGFIQNYSVSEEADPFNRLNWFKANPSLRYFPALKAVYEEEARDAQQDANELQSFRAFASTWVPPTYWKPGSSKRQVGSGARARRRSRRGSTCWGSTWAARLRYPAQPHFTKTGYWIPSACSPSARACLQRGQSDGVGDLYTRAARQGELYCGGRVRPGYRFPTQYGGRALGPPRSDYCGSLQGGGTSNRNLGRPTSLPLPLSPVAMGYKDGAEDVRRFQEDVR